MIKKEIISLFSNKMKRKNLIDICALSFRLKCSQNTKQLETMHFFQFFTMK
jgi:hypothetical protein